MDLTKHENDKVGEVKTRERRHTPLCFTYLYWKKLRVVHENGREMTDYEKMPYAVIAEYQPTAGSAVFVGVSRCSEKDQFRRDVGRHIAAGRAMKAEKLSKTAWATRLKAGGSAYAEYETALIRMRKREPINYVQAANALLDFCNEIDLNVVEYEGGE